MENSQAHMQPTSAGSVQLTSPKHEIVDIRSNTAGAAQPTVSVHTGSGKPNVQTVTQVRCYESIVSLMQAVLCAFVLASKTCKTPKACPLNVCCDLATLLLIARTHTQFAETLHGQGISKRLLAACQNAYVKEISVCRIQGHQVLCLLKLL